MRPFLTILVGSDPTFNNTRSNFLKEYKNG